MLISVETSTSISSAKRKAGDNMGVSGRTSMTAEIRIERVFGEADFIELLSEHVSKMIVAELKSDEPSDEDYAV